MRQFTAHRPRGVRSPLAATALKLGGGGVRRLALTTALLVLIGVLSAVAPAPTPAQDRWLDLPAPTGVAVVNGEQPGAAVISWQPVAGAAFYRIAWIAAADAAVVAETGGVWRESIAFTDVTAAAAADTQQHTLARLNPGVRYTFLVGSLRVKAGTPSWSLPAELNLTVGVLQPDSIREITVPVGLTVNEPGASGGYTLFRPTYHGQTYLIDHAGQLIHQWDYPLHAARLLENGNVLGARGGVIREIDPAGNLLWEYRHPQRQHHDFLKLPNGNVLLLVREIKTSAELIAAGANPAFAPDAGLAIDGIVEVRPIYPDRAAVVWKWSAWDHLVQDYDPARANYGKVAEHPELIDLNYVLRQLTRTERFNNAHWSHANGLDYHPNLDQILISARNFGEIWIIDHSTTTDESAGPSGGRSGQGGRLLYRWGNPQAYRAGTFADQQLFGPHSPHWIPEGLPGAGNILIFNNGDEFAGRYLDHSSVVELTPPVSGYSYARDEGAGSRYGPAQPTWTYASENPADFLSYRGSNAQRLPDGNTLIVNRMQGTIFEVTPAGATVWQYVNPVVAAGRMYQGDPMKLFWHHSGAWSWDNTLYRAYRYAPDYPGLQHYDLTPQGTVERYRDAAD